jgi:acetyl esterase/lipase
MSRPIVVLAVAVALWTVMPPLHAGQSGTRVERDVPYGPDPAQRLDLSLPAVPGFPTLIFVHGGSLTSGDKSDGDYGRVCDPFPAEGIACANVNYRLMPGASWPAQPEDVAAAIAWVHHNIAARGGNPARLVLLGHSSGAMLVGLVGAQTDYLARHSLTSRVLSGVMPMGSIMWDADLRRAIEKNGRARVDAAFGRDPRGQLFGSLDRYESQWPINFMRAGLPPHLFLIAESEQINPPILSTNQAFVDQSRARGNEAALTVFAGRTHYSTIRQLHQPGDEVFAAILAFVRQQR